jgi:hypothetical protein
MAASGDDLSLLFRIRGDASGARQATKEAKQAVAQLRQTLGPELSQTVSLTNKTFSDIADNLNVFVGQRLPLVGGAFIRVTENIRNLGQETSKQEASIKKVADQISNLSSTSGKSIPQLAQFLTQFAQIEGQANRDAAAIKFFGAEVVANNAKLIPAAEEAASSLALISTEAEDAGTAIAGMVGPIGIAVVAIGALVAAEILAGKELFDLTKKAAEFEGKMVDLSQQTGVTVETLSALEILFDNTGGNIDSATNSLVKFQTILAEGQDPQSKAAATLKKLNINATDTESAFRQAFVAIGKMPEGFAQTNAAAELFGARGGKQILAIIKETNGNLDEAINRFRDLGILISDEDAKAADKFNDELANLDKQLRAASATAAKELIPAFTEIIVTVAGMIRALRPLINIFGEIAGPAARGVASGLHLIGIAVAALSGDYKELARQIKEANEASNPAEHIPIPPQIKIEQPIPITPIVSPQAQAEANEKKIVEDSVELRKRALAEIKRVADEQNAIEENQVKLGQRNAALAVDSINSRNKKVLQAELELLAARKALAEQQQREAEKTVTALGVSDETREKAKKEVQRTVDEIANIEQEARNKGTDADRAAANAKVTLQLQQEAEALAHSQRIQAIEDEKAASKISAVQRQINTERIAVEEGNAQLEAIENAELERQRKAKEKELSQLGPQSSQRQRVLDELAAFETKRTALEQSQQVRREEAAKAALDRRVALEQDEARRISEAANSSIDTTVRIAEIGDSVRIAALKAAGETRLRTAESIEQAILKIRLDANEREKDAAEARLTAVRVENQAELAAFDAQQKAIQDQAEKAKTVTSDPAERLKIERNTNEALTILNQARVSAEITGHQAEAKAFEDFINKLKILRAERLAIESQGEQDTEDARQKDLRQERQYQEELTEIRERINEIERDTAAESIRLMQLHFAKRKDIIRAQRDLELADEAARHRRETEKIRSQQEEVDEEIRIIEQHLKDLKIGTQEEIDEYDRLIKKLEELRLKREELRRQQDAEDAKNKTRQRRTTDESKRKEKETDPLDQLKLGKDQIKKIAEELQDSVVPIGDVLKNTFLQVADAIGSVVSNWVLLGETGPAVMRKILAQALASIAAEAAVNAVKELAVGFALLAVGDFSGAGSAFTSAAIWGAIGGVAAIAGRSVAGDLFKQKASKSGGESGSPNQGQLNPLTLGRNQPQPTQTIILQVQSNDSHIIKVVGGNYRTGGELREIIINDSGA